jgi:hypothetical protein
LVQDLRKWSLLMVVAAVLRSKTTHFPVVAAEAIARLAAAGTQLAALLAELRGQVQPEAEVAAAAALQTAVPVAVLAVM